MQHSFPRTVTQLAVATTTTGETHIYTSSAEQSLHCKSTGFHARTLYKLSLASRNIFFDCKLKEEAHTLQSVRECRQSSKDIPSGGICWQPGVHRCKDISCNLCCRCPLLKVVPSTHIKNMAQQGVQETKADWFAQAPHHHPESIGWQEVPPTICIVEDKIPL